MPIDELSQAFALLSKARVRAEAFSQKAAQDGDPAARPLAALAASLEVQTGRLLLLMRGKIAATEQNMAEAFGAGLAAIDGQLARLAAEADQTVPGRAMEQCRQALAGLRALSNAAGQAIAHHVCQVCGHVQAGEPPERCPVCGAVRGKFAPLA